MADNEAAAPALQRKGEFIADLALNNGGVGGQKRVGTLSDLPGLGLSSLDLCLV